MPEALPYNGHARCISRSPCRSPRARGRHTPAWFSHMPREIFCRALVSPPEGHARDCPEIHLRTNDSSPRCRPHMEVEICSSWLDALSLVPPPALLLMKHGASLLNESVRHLVQSERRPHESLDFIQV